MSKAGLDNRHRNTDGEISGKHGNTLISTLRKIYGQSFAAGYPETAKLTEVLLKLNETSLSQLRRDHETGHLDRKIVKASPTKTLTWMGKLLISAPFHRDGNRSDGRERDFISFHLSDEAAINEVVMGLVVSRDWGVPDSRLLLRLQTPPFGNDEARSGQDLGAAIRLPGVRD
jgi:hypothetical protein